METGERAMSGGEAVVTIGVAIMGAWWSSGGRGALQRRKIQHELGLADRLHDPLLSDSMRSSAEKHAAIYLGRALHADTSTKTFLLTITPLLVGIGLLALTAQIGGSPELVRATGSLLAGALIFCGLGAMGDSVLRDGLAWLGTARSEQARSRLAASVSAERTGLSKRATKPRCPLGAGTSLLQRSR